MMNLSRRQLLAGTSAAFAAASLPAWAQLAREADRDFISNEDTNTLAEIEPNSNQEAGKCKLTSYDEAPRT